MQCLDVSNVLQGLGKSSDVRVFIKKHYLLVNAYESYHFQNIYQLGKISKHFFFLFKYEVLFLKLKNQRF